MPTLPGIETSAGLKPILHLPGLRIPAQFGPSSRTPGYLFLEDVVDPRLIVHRDVFGHADDEGHAACRRFEDGVGGKEARAR